MNWDYHTKDYRAQAQADPLWALERKLLYGLNGEKLNRDLVIQHFETLKIPVERKDFLALLLWNKGF